ncbi:MAG: phosphotransferase, partial [Desulfobacula sp.]|nr:phosphotransferase [Desulfobacula sp.]
MTDKKSHDSIKTISKLMEIEYDFSGEISRLAGENENYLIKKNDGTCFVLKLADDDTTAGMIEIEHIATERLIDAKLDVSLPRVILTRTGSVQACLMTKDRKEIRGRLLEFVQGKAWCDALPATNEQLEDLGSIIAQMNTAMSFIIYPDSKKTHHWDLAEADQHRPQIPLIDRPERRQILEWVFHLYAAVAMPLFKSLPKSLIHGDINDDNVLVTDNRVSGILDFGDCLANPTICDLAIALAYHTLDEDNPLEAAATIIAAYHKIRPLSMDEMTAIFPLMCTRLAVSVIISAQRRKIEPTRESWFVSEERAWKKLEVLSTTGPAQAAIIL